MNLSAYPIVDDLKMSIDTRNQAPSSKGAIPSLLKWPEDDLKLVTSARNT